MSQYNIVAETSIETVVAEYIPDTSRKADYQSEAALEKDLISRLCSQGYEEVKIINEEALTLNLRHQIELLNNYVFSDKEWNEFFSQNIAGANDGIAEKTFKIQEDYVQNLKCDNGNIKNIKLIDKINIHNNRLQVINQYEENSGAHKTRYDVTILVNGLPLVHIELKRRGVAIREAFNQINRYQRDSFPDIADFTKTFFSKHTILNILTRYCVFTSEKLLLVMRPYQIAATERILNRIEISNNYKKFGTLEAGGYIWHTTGSGKTLTSFKTAQIASKLSYIDKVLFVVDRKDLDYQTMKEYDRFEKGAANGNTSTKILKSQLESPSAKIIVTTIQKLDVFINKNKGHKVFAQHIVLIFDECHRSQFGDMHNRIIKTFKKYHIFGFTGTPIFSINAIKGGNPLMRTTPQAFGDKLHTYTIVNAINDDNVLPFRIDYVNTIKEKEGVKDIKVRAIDVEKAMSAPERITEVTKYILEHFNQKTKRSSFYTLKGKSFAGFNSIFAVASIPMAMQYYTEFKRQLKERSDIVIATIFSFSPNEEESDGIFSDEQFETDKLDKTSRDFLESAITDYNNTFKTKYDTSADKFQNYYKDVSDRVKKREVDLLIVVNMFLTGFDATTLNTLWVDKNMRQYGLIQAFSRTNRILNSVKTFGNIVCFRDLKDATDEAIALFGDKEAGGLVLLKTFDDYYFGFEENGNHKAGYVDLIIKLQNDYPLGQQILGETAQKDFIKLFGAILRLKNILTSFDDFAGREILSSRDFQDYQSIYIDLYQEFTREKNGNKENINEDIEFEMELIKQVDINIDYILMLVAKYHDSNCTDKSILAAIDKAVGASLELRSKKKLIEDFINQVNVSTIVEDDWSVFVKNQKENDLSKIIVEENLKPKEARKFILNSFRDGALKTTGTDIDKILPPISRFSGGGRAVKKSNVIDKLTTFFEKYQGLC